jgi:Flp pilus assembly pilin Flp
MDMQLILGIYRGAFYERNDRHSGARQRALDRRRDTTKRKRKVRRQGENMPRLKNRKGQGLVEYVLAVALMAVLVIGGIRFLGKKTHNAFVDAGTTLQNESSTAQTMSQNEGKVQ